jgi:hypothetical protein
MPDGDGGDPRRDPIYLGVMMALMATVSVAAVLSIAGELWLDSPALKHGGFAVAIVAGLVYFAFRVWGTRRAEQWRQARRQRRPDDEEPPAGQ